MELQIRGVGGENVAIPARARERQRGKGTPFRLEEHAGDAHIEPSPEPLHEHGEIAPPDEGEAGRRLDVSA